MVGAADFCGGYRVINNNSCDLYVCQAIVCR